MNAKTLLADFNARLLLQVNGTYTASALDAEGNNIFSISLHDFSFEGTFQELLADEAKGLKELVERFGQHNLENLDPDTLKKIKQVDIKVRGFYRGEFEWKGRTLVVQIHDWDFTGNLLEYYIELWKRIELI